jgi:hypothetical protein
LQPEPRKLYTGRVRNHVIGMSLSCTCGGELSKEKSKGRLSKQEKFVCTDCGKEGWYVERRDGKRLFIGCVG